MRRSAGRFSLILAFILIFSVFLSSGIVCSAENGVLFKLSIEQVKAVVPNFSAYVFPVDSEGNPVPGIALSNSDVEVKLDLDNLTVDSIENVSSVGTAYYFVADVSSATCDAGFLQLVRASLVTWVQSMNEKDRFVLITYGKDVKLVLDGTQTESDAVKAIKALQTESSGNNFGEAVETAVMMATDTSSSLPGRAVITVIDDGRGPDKSGVSYSQVESTLIQAGLPLYAIAPDVSGAGESRRATLDRLAGNTGGSLTAVTLYDAKAKFLGFHSLMDGCYVVTAHSANNVIGSAEHSLSVTISKDGEKKTATAPVSLSQYIPDTSAPVIRFEGLIDSRTLSLIYSEPVEGADNRLNYELTGTDGTAVLISDVHYDSAACKATLYTEDQLFDGEYTLTVSHVSDISMEKNALAYEDGKNLKFTVSGYPMPEEEEPENWWEDVTVWIIVGVALLIIGCAVTAALVFRKHKKDVAEQNRAEQQLIEDLSRQQHEYALQNQQALDDMKKNSGVAGTNLQVDGINAIAAVITVIQNNGVRRAVDVVIGESFTVGRKAGECQLAVADQLMSGRHFRLSYRGGQLLISDLGSTNGTYLNNMRIASERPVSTSDIVLAGNTRFTFAPKRG